MNNKNCLKAKWILALYLTATLALLVLGYSVRKPAVAQQEFPFTITYSFQGRTETISGVYVGEYLRKAMYMGNDSTAWYGYIKDHNRLEATFYRIAETDGQSCSINLNLEPGYLMGDPRYAGSVCAPTTEYHSFDGTNEHVITDAAELEQMGFSLVSWEYPEPIENTFTYGGISMSSEATIFTTAIALAGLLACMILIRKDPALVYRKMDKLSIVLNVLIAIIVLPFVFLLSILSEILADASVMQQFVYLLPAVTVLGIAGSVTLRRCGYRICGLLVQFAGPFLLALVLLTDSL